MNSLQHSFIKRLTALANIFLYFERRGEIDLFHPTRLCVDIEADADGLHYARVLAMPFELPVFVGSGALCVSCAYLALRNGLDRILAEMPYPTSAEGSTSSRVNSRRTWVDVLDEWARRDSVCGGQI